MHYGMLYYEAINCVIKAYYNTAIDYAGKNACF